SETGKPVYVVNGNHDTGAGKEDITNEKFREIYNDFGYGEALETQEGTLSYTADLNEKYRLIAADSCDPSVSTEDGLTADRVDWIVRQAKKAYADGKYPILMMHHNLLSHMPLQRILSRNFIVRNHEATARKFADAGIKAVFTGHEHGSDVMTYTSPSGNTITDFSTTSLTMFPLAYRFVEFTDDEITYSEKAIEKIDFDALTAAVDGYTDKQLTPMREDFRQYSKDFFKAGIRYRLWLGLTPEKLGIDEDAFYADIVYTAVGGLTEILDMPLYGEGGLQEKAKEYGIDIPDSGYKNGWDAATEVVGYHYAGSEPFALDSTEVTLILRIADYLLLEDLSTVNDKCFLSLANSITSNFGTDSICKDFTKAAAKTLGPVTAGEYFIVAIASPLLYGLAYDRDGLDDNNGSIPGYGAENSNSANISADFTAKFNRFFLYVSFFFRYILKIFGIGR
ncbi:MAG: metallophosphoesterase, partial [Clostridia bacterium]|nr:metallophosphoesterase [Clostridia bacterium]